MEEKAPYAAQDVALWFLNYVRSLNSEEDEEHLSNLKLQKLLYYAQGTYLAIKGKPLFGEEIQHWTHGPVVPAVYYKYCSNRGNPIPYDETFSADMDNETNSILAQVYETFGQYSAWGLRNLSHSETPWISTKTNEVIPLNVIKKYFEDNYIE